MFKMEQPRYDKIFILLFVAFVFIIIMFSHNVKADTIITGDLPALPEQIEFENYIIYTRSTDGFLFLVLFNNESPIVIDFEDEIGVNSFYFTGDVGSDLYKRYALNAMGDNWVYHDNQPYNSSGAYLYNIGDVHYSNNTIKIKGSDETFFFKRYLYTNGFTWLTAQQKIEGNLNPPSEPDPPLDTSPSGPFSWISQGLETVKNGFTNGLGGVMNGITNLTTDIGNVASSIANLPNLIIDGFKSALEFLFVPKTDIFANLKEQFDNKLPIIGQITELFSNLFDFGDSENAPSINITWHGQTMNAFDLSWYAPYRTMVKGIMSAFMWLSFILWIPKFIPKLLGGIE